MDAPQWRQLLVLAVATASYAAAVALGGSGFIAAFVAGWRTARPAARGAAMYLAEPRWATSRPR